MALRNSIHIWCVLSLATIFHVSGFDLEELPHNKMTALYLLGQGDIDSTFFKLIEPLYDSPIDVASGELSALIDIFPHLRPHIPSDDELSEYLPLTYSNQKRLLHDYPVLALYRPILSFSGWTHQRTTLIVIDSRLRPDTDESLHSMRFNISDKNMIFGKGTVDFDDETARWRRRQLAFRPSEWLHFQVGNLTNVVRNTIVYGRFGKDSSTEKNSKSNWLYSNTRGWNGANLNFSMPSGPSIKTAAHFRSTEQVFYSCADVPVNSWFSFLSGLSYFRSLEEENHISERIENVNASSRRAYIAHLGVEFDYDSFLACLNADIINNNPGSVPIRAKLLFKRKGGGLSLDFVHFPPHVSLPLSREYNSLAGRVSLIGNRGLTEMRIKPTFELHDLLSLRAYYRITCAENKFRYTLSNKISVDTHFPLSLIYRYDSGKKQISRHNVAVRQSAAFGPCELFVNPSFRISQDTLSDMGILTRASVEFFSFLLLETEVAASKRVGRAAGSHFGLIFRTELFEKTFGAYGIRMTYENRRFREVEIDAETSFCF